MNEPLFKSLTEEGCFKMYGFSKEDMEKLYNEGKPMKYAFSGDDALKEIKK